MIYVTRDAIGVYADRYIRIWEERPQKHIVYDCILYAGTKSALFCLDAFERQLNIKIAPGELIVMNLLGEVIHEDLGSGEMDTRN